jgi:GT2 family glycosyltransferase
MYQTAIVILNWNGLDWLKKFLGTVVSNSTYPETVVYVADNGSADGSPEWVASNYRDVRIIWMEKNNGFAGGYNIALRQIEAKYYVLLNSDIEVTSGWLKPLIRYMDDNPDVASCQPKIRSFRNRDYFEYAGAAGGFIDKYGYPFCRGRIFNYVEKDIGQYDNTMDVFWTTGACMVVRAEAWRRCGGFDDDFFAHMEEIDLCWRLHKAGYRVSCVPDSIVYHVGGGMLPYESELKTYLNFRNNLFMLYKNLPDIGLGSTMFIRRVLDGLAALTFLLKGKFSNVRAVWNAHRDYKNSMKILKSKRAINSEMTVGYPGNLILNKSVIFQFYIGRRRTFRHLYGQK